MTLLRLTLVCIVLAMVQYSDTSNSRVYIRYIYQIVPEMKMKNVYVGKLEKVKYNQVNYGYKYILC